MALSHPTFRLDHRSFPSGRQPRRLRTSRPRGRRGVLTAAALSLGMLSLGMLRATAASAAPPDEPRDPTARFEKHAKALEQRVREKLAPKLELDDEQTDQLVDAMKGQMAVRHAARQAMRAERKALKALLDAGASDAELQAQLDRLDKAAKAMPKKGALLEQTSAFLSTEQQSKLVLAMPKMKMMKHKRRGHRRHGRDL